MNYLQLNHLPKRPRRQQTGFSRSEIAVVLTIVTALSLFLFRQFSNNAMKERARGTVCASNLKSLAAAYTQYAADNNNCYPMYTTYAMFSTKGKWFITDKFGHAMRPNPARPDLLIASLKPYTHTDQVWFCPSDPLAHNNNLTANRIIDVVYSDHRYSSYVTEQTFANYPTTPNGFEYLDQAGKHHFMGGDDPSNRTIMGEEYIRVPQPHSFFRDMLFRDTPFSASTWSPLYSHQGRLNSVAVDGHLISNELPRN